MVARQHGMWEGAGIQSYLSDIYIKLKFTAPISPILATVSFRQLPWASADYSRHIYCGN